MGKIIDTFKHARGLDRNIFEDKNESLSNRLKAMGNANGRKFIIGSISGACRLVKSVAMVALAVIGALFCVAGVLLSSPLLLIRVGKGSGGALGGLVGSLGGIPVVVCLSGIVKCGEVAFKSIKNAGRGVVEIVPFTGYALAKHDINQHNKNK